MLPPPIRFRRLLLAFARLGLDIRPMARRFRNAILRLYRAEVAAEIEQIRFALQHNDEASATLDQRVKTDIATLLERIAVLEQAIADARSESLAATAMLKDTLNRLTESQTGTAQHAAQALCAIESRLSAHAMTLRSAAADRDALHERDFLLEQLLTGTGADRPPGAARAVARLPDPAVAVILPTSGRASFVGEAIASVQAQSFTRWELIVVDDGSTDGTAETILPFLNDSRIRYVPQPKAGAAAARNRGLAESTAPLIAYLDSDNLWYPDFIAKAVDCLATETDVDLVYGALVSCEHELDRRCILWSRFDRDALLSANFIDTNVIVHRRDLVAHWGGWDGALERLTDWDLVLRYTKQKPARQLNVLAARYRTCDDQRISRIIPTGPDDIAIRRKWFPPASSPRPPRVLYMAWHYPHLSERYVETELRCMRGWGVHVEVWRTASGPAPYPISVPVHEGTLSDAIEAARPDILHVHWLSYALAHEAEIAAAALPVTVRLHGFDTTREGLALLLAQTWVKRVYGYPSQIARDAEVDPRLRAMPVVFESALFKPRRHKDRRMVVRTSAGLPSKNLELFLQAALVLPEHRFVLAVVTCQDCETYIERLQEMNKAMGSPAELRIDVSHDQVARLVGEAAIYLHTACPQGSENATPVGQPGSIAEAMASGCYCFVRDEPALAALVLDAGATYRNVDDLVGQIRATQNWTGAEWAEAQRRAVERAYRHHADVTVLQPLFNEWMDLSKRPDAVVNHAPLRRVSAGSDA